MINAKDPAQKSGASEPLEKCHPLAPGCQYVATLEQGGCRVEDMAVSNTAPKTWQSNQSATRPDMWPELGGTAERDPGQPISFRREYVRKVELNSDKPNIFRGRLPAVEKYSHTKP